MKNYVIALAAGALSIATSGCSSFIDINQNPNSLTAVTPDAQLASALATTAANYTGNNPSYNSYASWAAGYWGKTGVVSGYGEELTYNYSSSYYAGLWDGTYDNLEDYAQIQTNGSANGYPYHAAIARIMKVYNFLLLVDEYGDIPYTQALKGLGQTAPTYDKAADIYKDLIVQLTGAIADIKATDATATSTFTPRAVSSEDIVFGGNMLKWRQFANSLKLRILLRESQTNDATLNTYITQQMTALQASVADNGGDFITSDVVAQPGYAQNTGQQNPLYTRYAFTPSGTGATERSYQIPTQFIINQYLNNNDPRVSQLYTMGARLVNGASAAQYVGARPGESNSPAFNAPTESLPTASRFLGANSTAASGGIIKGLNAPTALMLLSEQLFSKAEAETRGLLPGGDTQAKADYLDGIKASFIYFYRAAATTNATINASTLSALTTAGAAGISQYNTFVATTNAGGSNASNPLVSYDAATSNGALGKQAIIIYQKYLAMNSVASVEAWDDYRRSAQPNLSQVASTQSQSPRADKLPTRLFYPLSEVSTNAANVPAGVTQYTKIFWDVVD
ncbi:SusD/RagB family nutrient-binding outer membrane lipoprotein [Hymenobacter sp. RP-2-7]|uniref:SusD/RagB family nutrient-binding outer membrane lipoprotein n=1 Tax=Hymenobacter polaris TaxID=2682546 RepID=A0A7Y0AHW3_9BACT|nr:SusD/RagB family nutrient-binding outer membrane lipoprotein [Hymenobacter polaris]NML67487.1 SusD/RagB family nutrient-binding outer membrane lipoprotein [Hymenobacter polaris]